MSAKPALLAVALSLVTLPALAQISESQDIRKEGEEKPEKKPVKKPGETLPVVGTHFRGKVEGSLPVELISREDIENAGNPTVAELMSRVQSNTGSDHRTSFAGGANGRANVNLKGLGVGATLVLFNGRRQTHAASAGTYSFVDINFLPSLAIDQVEILKGGASPIYGSDAVAGVVNFGTRDDFRGLEVQVSGANVAKGNQRDMDVGMIYGTGNARTQFMIAADYFKREDLNRKSRGFSAPDFSRATAGTSIYGRPAAFMEVDDNGFPIQGAYFPPDPECDPDNVVSYGPQSFCGFVFLDSYNLVQEEERLAAFSALSHEFSSALQVYGELGVYQNSLPGIPNSTSYPYQRGGAQAPIVMADHPNNPTGKNLQFFGRALGLDHDPQETTARNQTRRAVTGARGDLGINWSYDASMTVSANNFRNTAEDFSQERFRMALLGVGGEGCVPDPVRENNPRGFLFANANTGNCQYFNPFGASGNNSPELIEWMRGEEPVLDMDSRLDVADAVITGDLLELAGGPLQIAFGTQVRRESLSIRRNEASTDDSYYIFLSGGDEFDKARDVQAFFTELRVPIGTRLDVQAAVRFENFGSELGSSTDPGVGMFFRATDWLSLRGSATTTFRAPTLIQSSSQLKRTGLVAIADPLFPGPSAFIAVDYMGNDNLKPERARTWSFGPVIRGGGFQMSLDYYNIAFRDIIVQQTAQNLIDLASAPNPDPDAVAQVSRSGQDGTGLVDRVTSSMMNAPRVNTSGLDFQVSRRFRPGGGTSLNLGLDTSYILEYRIENVRGLDEAGNPADIAFDASGSLNSNNFARPMPKLKGALRAGISLGGHGLHSTTNYIGPYDHDDPAASRQFIDPMTTWDMSYSFRTRQSSVVFSVFNVMDKKPPFVDTNLNFDAVTHSPLGRRFQLTLRHMI